MVLALVQPVLADIGEVIVGLVAVIFLVLRQILEANKAVGPQVATPGSPAAATTECPKASPHPRPDNRPIRSVPRLKSSCGGLASNHNRSRAGPQPGPARPPQRPAQPGEPAILKC